MVPKRRRESAAPPLSESHALALLRLLDEPGAETAISTVKDLRRLQTVQASNVSPELLSDLSAAYYVLAQRGNRPADLMHALEAVEEALEMQPDQTAALFNQGLICEALSARICALRAWNRYLAQDPDSSWGQEAADRRDRLLRSRRDEDGPTIREAIRAAAIASDDAHLTELLSSHRREAAKWIEEDLLPSGTAKAIAGPSHRYPFELRLAETLASTLERLGGDPLPAAAVRAALRELQASDPKEKLLLASGLQHFAEGTSLDSLALYDRAEAHYRKAKGDLDASGNPLALRASAALASCLYQRQKPAAALREIELTLKDPGISKFPGLRGQLVYIRGSIYLFEDQRFLALRDYRDALAAFERLGDRLEVNVLRARIAELLLFLGQEEKGWRELYRGLPALNDRATTQRFFVHTVLTRAAAGLGCALAAYRIDHEDPDGDKPLKPDEVILDQLRRANTLVSVGRVAEAGIRARQARTQIEGIEDFQRSDLLMHLEDLEGRLALPHDPAAAARHFDLAIEICRKTGAESHLVRLYEQYARALLASGRREEAKRILAQAVARVDSGWKRDFASPRRTEDEIWPADSDPRQVPIDELVDLLATDGQVQIAFEVSEMGRARELLDSLATGGWSVPAEKAEVTFRAKPLKAKAIQKLLRPRQTLIAFSLLEDHTWAWVVDQGNLFGLRLDVSRAQLRSWLSELAAIREDGKPDDQLKAVLAAIYDRLISPWLERVSPVSPLVFVPDEDLHSVPFAALFDRTAKRYLIEDHPIAIAPSATLFGYANLRDTTMEKSKVPRVLAVGNPTFDREVFVGLEPLPSAESEAKGVAALYPRRVILLGSQATPKRMLAAAQDATVVHFAGHAVTFGAASFLLLSADETSESGALLARQLLQAELRKTRLIFLSACSSAGGRPLGAQGVSDLVRPLLGAGIPAVVGTLWSVDDATTTRLAIDFHRSLLAGFGAAEALRLAQLNFLQGDNALLRSARVWAGFELIGTAHLFPEKREIP